MLTNSEYGARVREREKFTRSVLKKIRSKRGQVVNMTIVRKSGILNSKADITKPMTVQGLSFIRKRLQKAVKSAIQREFIGFLPHAKIKQRIVDKS